MYRYIQKTLDWGVKVASLAVTGPATWVVATQLFSDIESPMLLFVMRFAAVFLIEGVLLSNWLLLEFDKNATPEIKARYGLTALAMYFSLLVIGWRHEGPTGLVFRLALLAALIGSGWDTYVYTWQRATSRVDRSAENAGTVRRHARKLSIMEAKHKRTAQHYETMRLIDAENTASIQEIDLYGQRKLTEIFLQDQQEQQRLAAMQNNLLSAPQPSAGPPSPPLLQEPKTNGRKKAGASLPRPAVTPPGEAKRRSLSKSPSSSAAREDPPLKHNILGAVAEDPSHTEMTLAEYLEASPLDIEQSVNELVAEGALARDGENFAVTGETNGKRARQTDGRARR
jgi:hypothetical protein